MVNKVFELNDLNGENGVIMNGIAADDWSGYYVSSAGDVNGDGIDDVIIGANGAGPNGKNEAGQSYVVFGQSTWTSSLELSSLNGANGVVMNGIAAGDQSGLPVSAAGDVNGDGIGDVIIGARYADPNGKGEAGQSYLVFGQSTWTSPLALSSLDGANGVIMNGIALGDRSGISVSSAGDVNGDGIDDVIIGAYKAGPNGILSAGQSYLVFGQSTWTSPFELSRLDGANGVIMNGIAADDFSGRSVADAGDVNGDGIDDVIIGAYVANPNGKGDAGQSYFVFGQSTWTSPLTLSSMDGTNGVIINGIAVDDRSGISVSSAGDMNGDGIDDVIIGAYQADPNGKSSAGQSYLVFGQSTWTSPLALSSLDGTNGVIMNGIGRGDYSGWAVSAAGDVNGDGIDDVIIGAYGADPNGKENAGQSYLIFGQSTWTSPVELSSLDGVNSVIMNGIAVNDQSGWAVSSAGDVNGDGIDDVIIGAVQADPNGKLFAGQSYLLFGGAEQFSDNQLSIHPGETLPLNASDLAVEPIIGHRIFTVSEVEQGQFESKSNPGISITQFTQQQIMEGEVLFVHNGSQVAPSYVVEAKGITRIFSDVKPQAATVSFITKNKNNASKKNNATIPIAVGASVGIAALATAGLFAWRRHQRKQNATLPSGADVRLETVEMAHNPLHPATGRRVWNADTYAINGEERLETREWDAGTYAVREQQSAPNDERWNPTLYGTGGKNAQILGSEWDPALYEMGTDASDNVTYAVPFDENPDPESKKATRTATVRK